MSRAIETSIEELIQRGKNDNNEEISKWFEDYSANQAKREENEHPILRFSYSHPMLHAAYSNNKLVAQWLIDNGIDVNYKYAGQSTALMLAAFSGEAIIADLLIGAGADINAQDIDKRTPFMIAASEGNTDMAKLLADKVENINAADENGRTVLMYASKNRHVEIVRFLAEKYNSLVNIKDIFGQTALMVAAFNGHTEIVELLIEKGADVNDKDKKGKTAFDHAREGKNDEKTIEAILKHGKEFSYVHQVSSGNSQDRNEDKEEGPHVSRLKTESRIHGGRRIN
ncbi:ankyrin repeat domain-containing protein [Rickettsiales bacterium]|nr:ankyrin repeat domain-containing protein [Rickettsiales bacterium]